MGNSQAFQDAVLVFFPLFQRGTEGDFETLAVAAVAKSPLTPLYKRVEQNHRAFGA